MGFNATPGKSSANVSAIEPGSGATGAASHLAAEQFKYMAQVNIVRVPYKTGPLGLKDLIAGKVQMMIPSAGTVMPLVKSGQLKALAVTSAEPSKLVPGLPAVAASVPGYEVVQSIVMFAPAETPEAIVQRLNLETVLLLKTAQVQERLLNAGLEAVGSTPEELAAIMKAEMATLGKVVAEAGLRAK
jgi:tripartite-type tricarboxylate transporter receptor subunit TctC